MTVKPKPQPVQVNAQNTRLPGVKLVNPAKTEKIGGTKVRATKSSAPGAV